MTFSLFTNKKLVNIPERLNNIERYIKFTHELESNNTFFRCLIYKE